MLQLEFWNIALTVINLLILFVLMRIFLFKPVQKIIAKRQEEADKQFNEVKEKQNEADVLKSKYEEALSETETEKKKVLQEARKSADEEYQRIVKSARKEAEKIKIDAEADANSQKAQILKNAEKEIADMVIDATAKVVASEKATSNSAIYDRFLNKAGDE
ncbi:MAG: ATP synthase F0 subunit B [Lachnospiraceae bacterium]|nr:ATP synthase F0 subunit B [Lachnospiraceae bacterium]